jgi:ATP-dependent protease HslVU (ClpYQ) peptidase subunit
MSVVIALIGTDGDVTLGCDSLVTTDTTSMVSGSKLHPCGKAIIGFCGDIVAEYEALRGLPHLLRGDPEKWLNEKLVPHLRAAVDAAETLTGRDAANLEALVVAGGSVWTLDDDQVPMFVNEPHAAIGSGANFALGALQAIDELPELVRDALDDETRVRVALRATAAKSPFVGGELIVMTA